MHISHATSPIKKEDTPYWSQSAAQLLAYLQSKDSGLTGAEAQRRLAQVGPNVLQPGGSHAT